MSITVDTKEYAVRVDEFLQLCDLTEFLASYYSPKELEKFAAAVQEVALKVTEASDDYPLVVRIAATVTALHGLMAEAQRISRERKGRK